jgi:hypothetical protein
MPIKPPRLDDRTYEDVVREARALIPQYCPEWTHLGDSDPGMTLVQLFAWMTEMTLYRLNRVPDKTYVHFLNFIGEERKTAVPAHVPLTFALRNPERAVAEIPSHTRASTRQEGGKEALHFLTTDPVSVHGAAVERIVSVAAGPEPMVREIAYDTLPDRPQAMRFGGGSGLQLFKLDPVLDGPHSYTPDQFVYVRHEDFLSMGEVADEEGPGGTLRLRTAGEIGLPIAALFDWEYVHGADDTFKPVQTTREGAGEVLGLPEILLKAELPEMGETPLLGDASDPIALPEDVPTRGWIRGRMRYERWLVGLMEDELRITWRDDRGSEEREITNWHVRDVGRTVELFIQNLPPLRAGWTLKLVLVDHGMPAGRSSAFPRYAWSYRKGQQWLRIRPEAVEVVGSTFVISGPLSEMASDGFNLRAERQETVNLHGVLPGLAVDLVWRRPIQTFMASGPDAEAAAGIGHAMLPREPFQPVSTLPALLGMKLFLGSDLLVNRERAPVLLEIEIGFERDGDLVPEPTDAYHLQLTYRTAAGWQVVHAADGDWSRFTFRDLDPEGASRPERRLLRILIDPRSQLEGVVASNVGLRRTSWLRLELTRAALTWRPDERSAPVPVSLRLYDARFTLAMQPGATEFDERMPGTRVLAVEHRGRNRRFSRLYQRREGKVVEELPFDPLVVTDDGEGAGHRALYLKLDRPLPRGRRFATTFLCRGETFLPRGFHVTWELLQESTPGHNRWTRLASTLQDPERAYRMDRSGVLEFGLDDGMKPAPEGVWVRAVLRRDGDGPFPALPPVTHLLLNTVTARNLHGFRMEKFSGEGVPHQSVQLRHFPVWLPERDDVDRERITDLKVMVEEQDGEIRPWKVAPGNTFAYASKDDRVFVVDPVDGTMLFGNGIRGRILPIGSFNVVVESYHTVPGAEGNVAPGEVILPEGFGDLVDVVNVMPANGGRNAESIEEIIRRAPSILTSRDRAVTRQDFEIIAREASSEVARAACIGTVGADGGIEVVILPRRREDEDVPDPFVAAGLKEHVQQWLGRRCLVNVRPRVRLALFQPVDVSIDVRLRPNANQVQVRDDVHRWVRRFLDPYAGGLDGQGWPFGATLYAQDFGRLVTDIPEVRHVVEVRLYPLDRLFQGDVSAPPGWETSPGDLVLPLVSADLLRVREVRVRWAEGT